MFIVRKVREGVVFGIKILITCIKYLWRGFPRPFQTTQIILLAYWGESLYAQISLLKPLVPLTNSCHHKRLFHGAKQYVISSSLNFSVSCKIYSQPFIESISYWSGIPLDDGWNVYWERRQCRSSTTNDTIVPVSILQCHTWIYYNSITIIISPRNTDFYENDVLRRDASSEIITICPPL